MNKRLKGFKQRRLAIVGDADLGIEATEVTGAGFLKAVNVIEAQVEGYDPREVGLDIDKEATVDEIVDKFIPNLNDEQKAAYKAVLLKLKGEEVADEKQEAATDPEVEVTPSVKDDEDDFDERFKDPAFKAGFEAGVKYGEKREKADPERIDRDHEREGEERYLRSIGEDSVAKITAQVQAKMRGLIGAANKVRPLVGTIQDPMAFDSAEKIYAFALKQKGVNVTAYPEAAYAGMVDVMLKDSPVRIAQDSFVTSYDKEIENTLKALDNIEG